MNQLKIATRNIFRNVRRSLMTISAIAVGAAALLLFGEFFAQILCGLQTNFVTQTGHISIFKTGYFDFGSGNPTAYSIPNYEEVLATVADDSVLKPMINVATPTVKLFGIAGNFEIETSKTFFGTGFVPADFNKMRRWDDYNLHFPEAYKRPVLEKSQDSHGIVGKGLARILGLCEKLKLNNCHDPVKKKAVETSGTTATRDFGDLGKSDIASAQSSFDSSLPRLDLLAGTASGAPNVVSLYIDAALPQGVKEFDDSFIGMDFKLAQQLLYGRNEKSAIALVLQLHHTSDMNAARARLESLFNGKGWDLEIKDLLEVQPFYKQAVSMFYSIFSFIAAIMAVIVLFTVVNTMSMSVMERTNEIGTLRALGVRKRGITQQFVIEGSLLGIVGATIGIALGTFVGVFVNSAGLTWHPPGQAEPTPLKVLTSGVEVLVLGIWLGLILMATLASWFPARRAARMKIVDALGHV